jgi:hypothetical protein
MVQTSSVLNAAAESGVDDVDQKAIGMQASRMELRVYTLFW